MTDRSAWRKAVHGGRTALLVALAAAVPALRCSDGVAGPSDLIGGVWRLESMEPTGASRFVPDHPDRFAVEFLEEGRIGLVADCNQCGGSYTLSGRTLSVTGLACTLALCATPRGQEFTSVIDGSSTLRGAGDALEIESPEGRLALRR